MTFNQWLAKRRVTLTPRGDLILYLRGDRASLPEVTTIYALLGHLLRQRAPSCSYKPARSLWREYAREAARPVW